jgi:hypothetical protein
MIEKKHDKRCYSFNTKWFQLSLNEIGKANVKVIDDERTLFALTHKSGILVQICPYYDVRDEIFNDLLKRQLLIRMNKHKAATNLRMFRNALFKKSQLQTHVHDVYF